MTSLSVSIDREMDRYAEIGGAFPADLRVAPDVHARLVKEMAERRQTPDVDDAPIARLTSLTTRAGTFRIVVDSSLPPGQAVIVPEEN